MQKQGCLSEQSPYTVMYHLVLGLTFQSIHVFHMHAWNSCLCVQRDTEKRVYCQLLGYRAVVRKVTCKAAVERNLLSVAVRLELKYCRLWVKVHMVYTAISYNHSM